jgi:hypothetical protein
VAAESVTRWIVEAYHRLPPAAVGTAELTGRPDDNRNKELVSSAKGGAVDE